MFHGSARLTVHGRRLIVQRHQAGWKQAHIAEAMGVSRTYVTANAADRTGSASSSDSHPAPCRGSCAATRCPTWPSATRSPATSFAPPAQPASVTNANDRVSWSTWTSRSSARSPTAVAGVSTAAANRSVLAASATTTSTHSSTTTPAWPTPRSCPTRRARPAQRSYCVPPPTSPITGSRIERVITDNHLQAEWAYRHAFTSNEARAAALAAWIEHYNTERRHSALGGRPPISRLPTQRPDTASAGPGRTGRAGSGSPARSRSRPARASPGAGSGAAAA